MGIRINISPAEKYSDNGKSPEFSIRLAQLGLDKYIAIENTGDESRQLISFSLLKKFSDAWAADHDTTQLCQILNLNTLNNIDDLEREILLAMLLSPIPFEFPSGAELASAVRIRKMSSLPRARHRWTFRPQRPNGQANTGSMTRIAALR